MPQNPLDLLKTNLKPVKSHVSAPQAKIGPRSAFERLEEKILPMSDEPLAQRGIMDAVLGGTPRSSLPSMEDVGGMSSIMGSIGPKKLPIISPEAYKDVKAGGLRLYSRLTDTFAKAPGKMKPSKAASLAQSGASKEEISLRKLNDFLKGRDPMADIPREEIMGHLKANPLELDVVRKGAGYKSPEKEAINKFIHEMDTKYGPNWNFNSDFYQGNAGPKITPEEDTLFKQLSDTEAQQADLESTSQYHNPHVAQYDYLQTPGPKENYGESLINLPEHPELKAVRARQAELQQQYNEALSSHDYEGGVNPSYKAVEDELQQIRDLERQHSFQTAHWDEPNNLVWSRHNDRRLGPTEPTGKNIYGMGLDEVEDTYRRAAMPTPPQTEAMNPVGPKGRFIEEIQSDWHQQGRDRGYAGRPETVFDLDAVEDLGPSTWYKGGNDPAQQTNQWKFPRLERDMVGAMLGFGQTYDDALADAMAHVGTVPDAPFKDTYHELALKQQLLDAADDPSLEWLGVADADTASAMEGHSSVRPGMELNYNQKHPSALKKLLEPLGGEVGYDTINNASPLGSDQSIYWRATENPVQGGLPRQEIVYPNPNAGPTPLASTIGPNLAMDTNEAVRSRLAGGGQVPGQGMWKANLTPELKQIIKERGFPAMAALLAMQQAGKKMYDPEGDK